jgi:ABC-2 type transport system permease protein
MIITLLYAVVIAVYGDLIWAETIGSYIGFLFLGAGYISIGVLISASTENQLTAALITFFCLLIILFIEPLTQIIPADMRTGVISAGILAGLITLFVFLNTRNWVITLGTAVILAIAIVCFWIFQKNIYSGFMRKFLGWFSLNRRYQPFTQGLLKIDNLIYYTSFSALFLFLTVRVIEKRRWN